MTFRQIMLPLDGSDLAERALPYAQELATLTGSVLHLVRVCDLPPTAAWAVLPPYIPSSTYDEQLAAAELEAKTYLEGVLQRLQGVAPNVRARNLMGNTAEALLDYEREANIDLVVMAGHGRGGLARFALGSVANRLLHHGRSPLLLVRAAGVPSVLQRILVPLDGSPLAEAALSMAHALEGVVAHEVTLLRVISAEEERPEAERYLVSADQGPHPEHVTYLRRVIPGDPGQVIIDTADADKTIVMATHGRSGPARWALGSVSDQVARHAGVSVLLLRATTPSADPHAPGSAHQRAGQPPPASEKVDPE